MASSSTPIFDSAASLVVLAMRGELPRHQRMDLGTLQWISSHRPEELAAGNAKFDWDALRPLIVPEDWFATYEAVDGIHGVRHGGRVSALAGLIAELADLPEHKVNEARLAGALHDCRRFHDQDDVGHGARAAHWFGQHRRGVLDNFAALDQARTGVVAAAIELHDIPYDDFTDHEHELYDVDPTVCDIVKAADALDRYRLPKIKWWPRPELLRLKPPGWLYRTAFDLVITTEGARLRGVSNEEAFKLQEPGGT